MRFTRIDGTAVMVTVTSAKEAKAALKELRHKKKELNLLRRRLVREQKAARAAEQRAERARSDLSRRHGLIRLVVRTAALFRSNKPVRDLTAVTRDLDAMDETIHSLDTCIVQIEGKLLTLG